MKWFRQKSSNNDASDIHYGFSVIIIAFLIPSIFLFYFMVNFKEESIRSDNMELVGVSGLKQEVQRLQNNFFILGSFYGEHQKITHLIRDYRLQLDPGPNSFYMAVIASYAIPNTIDTIMLARSLPENSPRHFEVADMMEEHKVRTDTWLSYTREADLKLNGTDSTFQQSFLAEREAYFSALDDIVSSRGKNVQKDMAVVFGFWKFANESLHHMITTRIASEKRQLMMAVVLTLAAWFASLLFTVWFSQRVIERRRHLEEHIRQQNLTLIMASKMTALGELAGNIAHEINTPLGVIRLNAELIDQLIHEQNVPAQQISGLSGNLVKTVDKVSQIINSMLKYSRSDSSDQFVHADLTNIFGEALLLCQENLSKKSIELRQKLSPHLEIDCRPNEILQVMINLIKNSMDAVESLPEKWIQIDGNRNDGRVIFSITDSGFTKSIPDPAKIFTPFYSTKPMGKGTGLGLGISRRLIESHKGALLLDPLSEHTCFVIDLPATLANLEATSTSDVHPPPLNA